MLNEDTENKGYTCPGRVVVGIEENTGQMPKVDINLHRKKDAKLVKGRFNYLEIPGGTLRFVYRAYKGDPVIRYELKDGEIYQLPVGVAKHLNNNVGRIEHKYLLDAHGRPSQLAQHRIRRCTFENLEFMDIEGIGNTQIEEVTVTKLPPLKKG